MEFKTTDTNGVENEIYDEEEGQHATTDSKKFTLNAQHDLCYIGCEACGKAINFFT